MINCALYYVTCGKKVPQNAKIVQTEKKRKLVVLKNHYLYGKQGRPLSYLQEEKVISLIAETTLYSMYWPLHAGRSEVLKDRNKRVHGGTAEGTAELLGTETSKRIKEQPTQRLHTKVYACFR